MSGWRWMRNQIFQSTLSVRRATPSQDDGLRDTEISIHALREESDLVQQPVVGVHRISIHALREESDSMLRSFIGFSLISIHALREESDWPLRPGQRAGSYFNPRSP